jgi:polysaccharide export outer membrane protein
VINQPKPKKNLVLGPDNSQVQARAEECGMGHRRALAAAFYLTTCFGLLPVLSGCALLNGFLDPTAVGQFPLEPQEHCIRRVLTPREPPVGLANAVEPTAADLVPNFEDYRLAAGDIVAIVIPDLNTPGANEQVVVEVSFTGNVRVPLLGSVKVAGLTEPEVEAELNARYRDAGLLPNPDVRVYAQTRRGRTFYVRGAVGAPGQYQIPVPDLRLLDVVGLIQDIGATVTKFYVIRKQGENVGAAGPMRGLPPTEPQTPQGLILEPPPIDEGFQVNFSTTGGAGLPPPAGTAPATAATSEPSTAATTEPMIERPDLEGLLAPPETAEPSAPESQPKPTPFAPLIFDPKTGELIQPPRGIPLEERAPIPSALPAVPGAPAAPPAAVPSVPEPGEEGEFNWENIPELELEQCVIEIDARALFAGDPAYNIVIRNGDVINVPVPTAVYYLMGEVARPGVYAFNGRDITIQQALASCGGFAPFAWPSRAEVIRHEPGSDKQITILVNLDAIFAGLDDDFFLRDDDIVNVGTSIVAPFLFVIRNSFRFTYGFGFVYDRNFADKDAYGNKINPQIIQQERRQRRGLPF